MKAQERQSPKTTLPLKCYSLAHICPVGEDYVTLWIPALKVTVLWTKAIIRESPYILEQGGGEKKPFTSTTQSIQYDTLVEFTMHTRSIKPTNRHLVWGVSLVRRCMRLAVEISMRGTREMRDQSVSEHEWQWVPLRALTLPCSCNITYTNCV